MPRIRDRRPVSKATKTRCSVIAATEPCSVERVAALLERIRHHHDVQRIATTVLGLVASPEPARLRDLTSRLGERANVRSVLPEADEPALDRAVAAWREAAGSHVPSPTTPTRWGRWRRLGWTAWTAPATIGWLEVSVQAALQRWRAGSELPDCYLVVGAEELAATACHWYLGVLASAAPHRVVVAEDDHEVLVRTVRGLGAGRWWPALDRLMADVDRRVPHSFVAGHQGAVIARLRGW